MRALRSRLTVAAVLLVGAAAALPAQDRFGGPPKVAPKPNTQTPGKPNTPGGTGATGGGALGIGRKTVGDVPGAGVNANTNGNGSAPSLEKLAQMEREDYGTPATRTLHDGEMHGPTPATIPGGQVITTLGLLDLQKRKLPHVIIDVLGAPEQLPNAVPGVWMAQPGSFTDQVQTRTVQLLQQASNGQRDMPLIFYCRSPYCWMSYNAALRAINAGYSNVLWYRGGVESWRMAGQR